VTESHGAPDAPRTFPADRIFPGDGEMARLCKEFDWASTPLGPVGGWPLALRVMVSTVLRAELPMLVFWGPDLIQLYNDGFRLLLRKGKEHPAALGAPAREFWRDIWDEIGGEVEAAYGEGASTLRENRLIPIHRDGEVEDGYWNYSYSPLSDDHGEIGGVLVVCRETTEEILAKMEGEREAFRNLKEQAALLDRAPDAILVKELDHSIDYWNAGAERMYGWAREEVMGRSVRELLYDDPAPFDEATRVVLDEGEWAGELVHRRRNGETITVDGRWSLVRNEDGTPRRILSINTDATERKKLLGQFLRAQRMESIGTLAGGIAHDLNNVLSPILLSIAMLKEDLEEPSTREILMGIEESAKRGAEMVKQVLAFARGIEGVPTRLDFRRILGELERVVRDTFPRNIRFEFDFPEGLWSLSGDPTQIYQALMNLFVNARDAMPHGGSSGWRPGTWRWTSTPQPLPWAGRPRRGPTSVCR
jgi:PAS domain S-box-containing protein